jgi:hypothetical protein
MTARAVLTGSLGPRTNKPYCTALQLHLNLYECQAPSLPPSLPPSQFFRLKLRLKIDGHVKCVD